MNLQKQKPEITQSLNNTLKHLIMKKNNKYNDGRFG